MKNKKIAVLMAVYNGREWIEEQINSISNQQNVNTSIFISIDPSNDSSEEFCFDLQKNDTQIHILPTGIKFGSAAPNFFRLVSDVDLSDFDYIAFADQDDIWNKDKLERATTAMSKDGYDGYSSNVMAFWSNDQQVLINKAQPQVEWDYLFESAGPGCTFVLTQKLALELQRFVLQNRDLMRPVWLHDWFTYAFARAHNFKWYIDETPSMLYRQHETNQVGVNTGYRAFLYRIRFILSGKALEQSSLLATLCNLEKNPFVKKWHNHSRAGFFRLAFYAKKCRRKPSEQILFIFSCLLLSLVGSKSK